MSENIPEDVLHEAKLVLARKKFWTADSEKLLRRWKKQIRNRYNGHKEKESKFWYWFYGSAILLILLTAVSAVISFGDNGCDASTTFNIVINDTIISGVSSPPSNNNTTRFIVGTLAAIAAAIASISALMDFGGVRKAHKDASAECDALAREIEDLLQRPIVQRGDAAAEMQKIRNKFDLIVQNNPSVAEKYRTSLEAKTVSKSMIHVPHKHSNPEGEHATTSHYHDGHKLVAPPRASIVFDDTNIRKKKSPDTDALASIVLQNIEDMEKEHEEKERKIKEANECDTDDEEKDVLLPFDLDSFRPDDALETSKHKIVKESLKKAIQFELQRFEEAPSSPIIPPPPPVTVEKDKDEVDDVGNDDVKDEDMKKTENDLFDYL